MSKNQFKTLDGNEAAAYTAYRINEVCAIYPITPSSGMGEFSDEWSAKKVKNIWDSVPDVVEMQSEGGAAGAVHGSLQAGALTTTFTSSQGLLLMIPNMYKIAGELTSTVFNVAARTVATHALSIFGDHSDVMACRQTGFGLLASASVQEAHDFALIAQAASLESRIPFVHFFDGFRTTHEVAKIQILSNDQMKAMIDDDLVRKHRERSLSPDRPVLRGTAQNPDVFFQARETVNPFYNACPDIVQKYFDKFADVTGRRYSCFDYVGAPDAERVVVLMASGTDTVHETVDYMNAKGEKVGLVKCRLYRPFDCKRFLESLPATTKAISILDRTKEPGSPGEPLYLDALTALHEGLDAGYGELKEMPVIVNGRYGLSSKEFTPAMVKSVFDNLKEAKPKNHFTVGIVDDVSKSNLDWDSDFSTEPDNVIRCMFYGLGSDGTVGANKNTIKIIGENTDNYAQGYFVYDSKKAGAVTVSHLRFGPNKIMSPYLVSKANFVGCHQYVFLEKFKMLDDIVEGGTFLLNAPVPADKVWDELPKSYQEAIIKKKLKFFVIDADNVAQKSGMGRRINTVMQTCFFAVSGVLERDEAIEAIKDSIQKTYGKKGEEIVRMNIQAVENTIANMHEVSIPDAVTATKTIKPAVPSEAPEYVRDVLGTIIAGKGDTLPVSAFSSDGTFPTDTCKWEKRNIALKVPDWDPDVCIQCGKCVFVCPHSCIRMKVYEDDKLKNAPAAFKSTKARVPQFKELDLKFTLQTAPEDCTGCGVCVDVCPAKNKKETRLKAINMVPQAPIRKQEVANWDFFLNLPEVDRSVLDITRIRQQQFQESLFEFSGACAGCGETPYIKLATQLFGDRMIVANATGCSSIYGANLPTTPYAKNAEGRGPAWSNSLFEDNAEFGLGFRLAIDKQQEYAAELLKNLASKVGEELAKSILENVVQNDESDIFSQRERIDELKKKLDSIDDNDAKNLKEVADYLVKKSVWIFGGDGWAYDIGYGGLDHVLASGRNVNVLVLDTEVYSNTGGQMSKATPRGGIAKFAAAGKPAEKKDLGLMAVSYGNVYVARVAMGARDEHTLKAFLEAEAYNGPSIIIAYSHCIAHGINMTTGMKNQKAAVESGQWPIYRYHPENVNKGVPPFSLDCKKPRIPLQEYLMMENRFKMLTKIDPARAKRLFAEAQEDVNRRWKTYEHLASLNPGSGKEQESEKN